MSYPALVPYGWNDRWAALLSEVAASGVVPGRVVRHDSSALLVALPDGVSHVPVRSATEPTTVGDWIAVGNGNLIAEVLIRSSLLRREDPGGGEQLLAANVDLVVIVAGLDRPVKPGRLQRAVTMSWDAGATPVVVLSKSDLVADPQRIADDVAAANPGVDVVTLSSVEGAGVDEVRSRALGRTIVMLGESGAGKSTLTNALIGSEVADTGRVRTGDSKGRHTTTSRLLHVLGGGGVIIDSPGLRAMGLWADPDAVAATFTDVEDLAEHCRFDDCAHEAEPGCAVVDAVASGALPVARLEAFRAIAREAASVALRADTYARRRYERQFGRVAREAQRRKGRC
ncbi:MAG: ribosome small subunit-dependent GTPase A [Acidimicrobiales bacterium]